MIDYDECALPEDDYTIWDVLGDGDDESEDEPEDCYTCRGTGEGMYDGSSCFVCKGRGY